MVTAFVFVIAIIITIIIITANIPITIMLIISACKPGLSNPRSQTLVVPYCRMPFRLKEFTPRTLTIFFYVDKCTAYSTDYCISWQRQEIPYRAQKTPDMPSTV